jgi:hypothetical protein
MEYLMRKAERVAWLCRQADDVELEKLAADAGAGPLLAQILAAARSDSADIAEEDLDALDKKFTAIGIDALTFPRTVRGYHPLPGTSEHPVLSAWTCPRRICSRVEAQASGDQPPVCGLLRIPLQHTQLNT